MFSSTLSISEQRIPAYFLLWAFQPNNHAGSVKCGLVAEAAGAPYSSRRLCPGASQKILGSSLMPPIHAEGGFVPDLLFAADRPSQFFAGSDQGRITSLFKAIFLKKCPRRRVPFKRSGLVGLPMDTLTESLFHWCNIRKGE